MRRTTSWIIALAAGAGVGSAIGVAASFGRTAGFAWPDFLAFALATGIPVALMVQSWLVAPAGPERPEDSVEHEWMQRAHAATLLDLFIFTGITVAVCSLLGLPAPGMEWALLFGMADAALRMTLIRRREA
ncbi:hypothetical protein EXE58_02635 [Nocardioides seonyuensis]|uniref:Uncharacterized protein n=1 Tax=Nocardioides seonyuensis TaxID=2518371 RepID=A0A4P7IFJ6_9ACTN|nr:hypothetical protein [Nocardioides seonyuensis]QBX54471.1 hypothetical protein EXE58_02635 [Nocardioides seonyuensis]